VHKFGLINGDMNMMHGTHDNYGDKTPPKIE